MTRGVKRKLLLFGFLVAYFGIAYFLLSRFGITCVFQRFCGIPCPGCGMTRAAKSILSLDFVGAWGYNPLIFAMPYVFLYVFSDWKGKAHKYILLGIGILALINWGVHILRV